MRRLWWLGTGAVGAIAAAAWYVLANSSPTANIRLDPDNTELVAMGNAIYQDQCASCHGANLEGQADWRSPQSNGRLRAPPHDETGHTWHHPDALLFTITKLGPAAIVGDGYESDMPAYDSVLSDQEIAAVLSYIKSEWPEEIRQRHDDMNTRAEP